MGGQSLLAYLLDYAFLFFFCIEKVHEEIERVIGGDRAPSLTDQALDETVTLFSNFKNFF